MSEEEHSEDIDYEDFGLSKEEFPEAIAETLYSIAETLDDIAETLKVMLTLQVVAVIFAFIITPLVIILIITGSLRVF